MFLSTEHWLQITQEGKQAASIQLFSLHLLDNVLAFFYANSQFRAEDKC